MKILYHVSSVSLFLISISSSAKKLVSIGKDKPFAIAGGVAFKQVFYTATNQYSAPPVYKWITANAGYFGMTYSPYNNNIFSELTASVSKSFFDRKLRAMLSSSYNNTYTNSQRVSTILNGRINGSYTIQKKHNLNLSLVAVNRESKTTTAAQSFTEFTGTLGYSYAFGTK